VFVPVAFLGGLTGQFYRQFALTLAVSVAISAVVALTFTPALCALLLKPTAESHFGGLLGRFFSAFDRGFKHFTARYVGSVGNAIRRTVRSMVIFLILTAAALWLLHARPTGFMPDEDQGYLIGLVTLPVGASLQRTEAVAGEFSALLRKQPEIQATFAITGLNLLTGTTRPTPRPSSSSSSPGASAPARRTARWPWRRASTSSPAASRKPTCWR